MLFRKVNYQNQKYWSKPHWTDQLKMVGEIKVILWYGTLIIHIILFYLKFIELPGNIPGDCSSFPAY